MFSLYALGGILEIDVQELFPRFLAVWMHSKSDIDSERFCYFRCSKRESGSALAAGKRLKDKREEIGAPGMRKNWTSCYKLKRGSASSILYVFRPGVLWRWPFNLWALPSLHRPWLVSWNITWSLWAGRTWLRCRSAAGTRPCRWRRRPCSAWESCSPWVSTCFWHLIQLRDKKICCTFCSTHICSDR